MDNLGGKKKKKNTKKVSLNTFMNMTPSKSNPAANWADVTEDLDPSGKARTESALQGVWLC